MSKRKELTLEAAAGLLGCTSEYVRQQFQAGKIEGRYLTGRKIVVYASSVTAFKRTRKPRGRQRKEASHE